MPQEPRSRSPVCCCSRRVAPDYAPVRSKLHFTARVSRVSEYRVTSLSARGTSSSLGPIWRVPFFGERLAWARFGWVALNCDCTADTTETSNAGVGQHVLPSPLASVWTHPELALIGVDPYGFLRVSSTPGSPRVGGFVGFCRVTGLRHG